jgi:hypothetical protein
MPVPSSLFVKIPVSRAACDKWLASPIKYIGDYGDWPGMSPAMASAYKGWRDEAADGEFMSVDEFLENIADSARYFHREYDEEEGAYYIADALHGPELMKIASTVAALRGAEKFIDRDGAGFIYVFPAVSGGDPDALTRVTRGRSEFLSPGDASPDTLYFVNEAEEYIEAMLGEEEGGGL